MLAWMSPRPRPQGNLFGVASFTNLALSLTVNEIFIVTREVKDGASGVLKVPTDASLLIVGAASHCRSPPSLSLTQ